MYETSDLFLWKAFQYTEHGRAHYTQEALDHLHAQVADGELRGALTPDYPLGCRRVLNSDDYYPALQRENVTLETGAIAAIEPTGVRLADGRRRELDMLVHATGFETTGWKWSLDVVGRGGASLRERWADAPRAYLGIMVPDFPNMFVLYGPNTNLGHHSITFMLECQIEFILMATAALDAGMQRPGTDAASARSVRCGGAGTAGIDQLGRPGMQQLVQARRRPDRAELGQPHPCLRAADPEAGRGGLSLRSRRNARGGISAPGR